MKKKSKKYADFSQAGKINVQLDDEYYENGEMAKIQKIYDTFFRFERFSYFYNFYLQAGC